MVQVVQFTPLNVFEVEKAVKALFAQYTTDNLTDSQIISNLHDDLSESEKNILLEKVWRQYLNEFRSYQRLQRESREVLFPKAPPRVGNVSGQRDDAIARKEITAALVDLGKSRFNSLEEHAVALQRLARVEFFDGESSFVLGDASREDVSRAITYYGRQKNGLDRRIKSLEAADRFMGRVGVMGSFRECVDFVNQHGMNVDDEIKTLLMTVDA